MESLLALPPAEFLELGAWNRPALDAFVLGGGGSAPGNASRSTPGGDGREKREHGQQVDTISPVPSPKQSHPLEHSEEEEEG